MARRPSGQLASFDYGFIFPALGGERTQSFFEVEVLDNFALRQESPPRVGDLGGPKVKPVKAGE